MTETAQTPVVGLCIMWAAMLHQAQGALFTHNAERPRVAAKKPMLPPEYFRALPRAAAVSIDVARQIGQAVAEYPAANDA